MVRRFEFAHPGDVERMGNGFPIWNGAPSLNYPIINREELSTSMAGFVSARWGLVPGWARDGSGRPPPVNARSVVSQSVCLTTLPGARRRVFRMAEAGCLGQEKTALCDRDEG